MPTAAVRPATLAICGSWVEYSTTNCCPRDSRPGYSTPPSGRMVAPRRVDELDAGPQRRHRQHRRRGGAEVLVDGRVVGPHADTQRDHHHRDRHGHQGDTPGRPPPDPTGSARRTRARSVPGRIAAHGARQRRVLRGTVRRDCARRHRRESMAGDGPTGRAVCWPVRRPRQRRHGVTPGRALSTGGRLLLALVTAVPTTRLAVTAVSEQARIPGRPDRALARPTGTLCFVRGGDGLSAGACTRGSPRPVRTRPGRSRTGSPSVSAGMQVDDRVGVRAAGRSRSCPWVSTTTTSRSRSCRRWCWAGRAERLRDQRIGRPLPDERTARAPRHGHAGPVAPAGSATPTPNCRSPVSPRR